MRQALALALVACGSAAAPAVKPKPVPPQPSVRAEVPWDKLVGPVRQVDVIGGDDATAGRARTALGIEVGRPFDRAQLRSILDAIYQAGGVADVRVTGIQLDDGIRLAVDLVPQPKIHAITTHGNNPTVEPPVAAKIAVGTRLDPKALDSFAASMRDGYIEQGYVDATVSWTSTPPVGDQVDIVFEVAPGSASIIERRDYHGNAHAPAKELDAAIGSTIVPGNPWRAEDVERATLLISAYYYDHGYVNVRVANPVPPGGRAPIVFDITEGDQFKIGALAVTGVDAAAMKRYLALVGTKKGDVFSRAVIVDAVQKIRDASKLDVLPLTKVDATKKTIDLTFELSAVKP